MLQLFYDDFLSFVPLQLPQLLDVTTMEQPQFYDDYVLLSFPLAAPYDLEGVMDIFEDDMEADNPLSSYSFKRNDIRQQHVCLFQSGIWADVQDEREGI